jgi:hypothetical protein
MAVKKQKAPEAWQLFWMLFIILGSFKHVPETGSVSIIRCKGGKVPQLGQTGLRCSPTSTLNCMKPNAHTSDMKPVALNTHTLKWLIHILLRIRKCLQTAHNYKCMDISCCVMHHLPPPQQTCWEGDTPPHCKITLLLLYNGATEVCQKWAHLIALKCGSEGR